MSDKEVYQQMLLAVDDAGKEAATRHREQRLTGERPKPGEHGGEEEETHYMNYENLMLRLRGMRESLEWEKEKAEERERQKKEEEEKAAIPLCHHVRENAKLCLSAAVRGKHYCKYHLGQRGRRLKMARARARRERWRVELPPLEDLYAVQVGIQHVVDALGAGQIDRHDARVLLQGLRQAASNLRLPEEHWAGSNRFDDVEEVEWDSFEKEHGLAEDMDVDTPPDEAFPPATEPETEVTAEEPVSEDSRELQELLARDPEACKRRAAQLVRKYRRRLEQDRERLDEAVRVLEAMRRSDELHKKEPITAKAETGADNAALAEQSETGNNGQRAKEAS
jgi:hypothetical protein